MAAGTGRIVVRAESSSSAAATLLLAEVCAELTLRYRRPPSPFSPDEAAEPRGAMVVAWLDGQPVGCGALRPIDEATSEIKRMYVAPQARRRGVARRILAELERIATTLAVRRIILETGSFQPEALALYPAAGYLPIECYGRYAGRLDAYCFEKWFA